MQQEKESGTLFLTLGVYFSLIAGSVLHGIYTSAPLNEILTDGIISLLLAYVLERLMKYIRFHWDVSLQDKGLFVTLFFLANMLLAVANQEVYGYIWLLPVVVAAIGSGAMQAVVVFAALAAQNVLLHSDVFSARELLVVAIYGIVCIGLLIQELSKNILPYLAVIMLAVDGVLQILRYRFSLSAMRADKEYIIREAVSVVVLFLFVCVYLIFRRKNGIVTEEEFSGTEYTEDEFTDTEYTEEEPAEAGNAEEFPEEMAQEIGAGVLEPDYVLLLRLQKFSGQLFLHSMNISSVSAQAARYMEGNVRLAQAGGLYHEIGRITGEKDYVEAGIRLMEEYEFPEEIIAVIRQHSLHYEKPQSLEAAIVMFTDNIISTDEYLRRNGKRKAVSDEKLVDMIFKSRISKGYLEESGMSEEELENLQSFYVNQYFTV